MKQRVWCILFLCGIQVSFAQDKKSTPAGLVFTNEKVYKNTGFSMPLFFRGATPKAVDLSPKMPKVLDQRPLNSCVAMALGYACRGYYNIKNPNSGLQNYLTSPSFVYNLLNGGNNNPINIYRALQLLTDTGVCSLKEMPYVPNRKGLEVLPNPAQLQEAKNYKIETFRRVDLDNAVVRLKAELIASNPVLCASRYDKSYWMNGVNYNKPAYYIWDSLSKNTSYDMGHAIVIVGYNDTVGAFKFMNSFGTSWGNKGYGWISYRNAAKAIREAYVIKPRMNDGSTVKPLSPIPHKGAPSIEVLVKNKEEEERRRQAEEARAAAELARMRNEKVAWPTDTRKTQPKTSPAPKSQKGSNNSVEGIGGDSRFEHTAPKGTGKPGRPPGRKTSIWPQGTDPEDKEQSTTQTTIEAEESDTLEEWILNKLSNEISDTEYVSGGLDLYVDEVEIGLPDAGDSNADDSDTLILVSGFARVPDYLTDDPKTLEIVVEFYYEGADKSRKIVLSNNDQYQLITGQAASLAEFAPLQERTGYEIYWLASIPLKYLDLNTETQQHLIAQPVMFEDGFTLRVGRGLDFEIEWN
jgi:hypothetical protein